MARLNRTIHQPKAFTHEGAPAVANISIEAQLRRSVLSCLLWEDEAYESGKTIADRISDLAAQVEPKIVANLALEARHTFNLRHVPLLLLESLSRQASGNPIVANTVSEVITRPDEMAELLAVVFKRQQDRGQTKRKLPHGIARGIEKALSKFDEYQLAKWRNG